MSGRHFVMMCVFAASCVRSQSVACPDGRTCPDGTECRTVAMMPMCVTHDQITACDGRMELDLCTLAGTTLARCYDGACIDASCGNERVDPGEVCDDGNSTLGDGCSSECTSNETCGNRIVDPVVIDTTSGEALPNELCDDGNPISHDACASDCQLEAPTWQHLMVGSPSARTESGIVYDSARGRVVLFGGITRLTATNTTHDDLWEFDGEGWSLVPAGTAPPPRSGFAMAYDAARRAVVVFGGQPVPQANSAVDDTWELVGSRWTARSPAHSPSPRTGAVAVYDSRRHRTVLFGGVDNSGTLLDDTWEWDGTDWTRIDITPRPSARNQHVMAFDPKRGVIVMAGGANQIDTWEFDGTQWRDATPANASDRTDQRTYYAMAYDRITERVITWGGIDMANAKHVDTWGWNGTVWTKLLAGTSSSLQTWRRAPMMIGDPVAGDVYLFGGWLTSSCGILPCTNSFADTWKWNGSTWTQVTPPAPAPRELFGYARDSARDALVIFGGRDGNGTPLAETWELAGDHWTQLPSTATAPSVRSTPAMAYDAAHKMTVLFGGESTSGKLDDTWTWDGTQWTRVLMSGPPSARGGAAMAYDPVRARIVMFGGIDGPGMTNAETWEWDGSSWTQMTPATSPPKRGGAQAIFDPVRRHVVLMAGTDSPNNLNDAWEWDGSTWSPIPTTIAPAARAETAIAWNAPRQRIDLFGGKASGADLGDTWELGPNGWNQVVPNALAPAQFGHSLTSDGAGVLAFGGTSGTTQSSELWRLRWTSEQRYELCTLDVDEDGDGLAGCADPDCWSACSPLCPPATTCGPSWPHCGDGVCNATLEGCRLCPQDCGACPATCGDTFCDPPETATSCPGDC